MVKATKLTEEQNAAAWHDELERNWAESDLNHSDRMIAMSKSQIRWNVAFIIVGIFILIAEATFTVQAIVEGNFVSAALFFAIFLLWVFIEAMQITSIGNNRKDITLYTIKKINAQDKLRKLNG